MRARIEFVESQLAELLGKGGSVRGLEVTVSSLLSDYVRGEMSDRGIERASILNSLANKMNEYGANFVRMELEMIVDRVDNSCYFGRVRAIVKRISELEILLREDGKPYTVSELLAMPLGFDLIQED